LPLSHSARHQGINHVPYPDHSSLVSQISKSKWDGTFHHSEREVCNILYREIENLVTRFGVKIELVVVFVGRNKRFNLVARVNVRQM